MKPFSWPFFAGRAATLLVLHISKFQLTCCSDFEDVKFFHTVVLGLSVSDSLMVVHWIPRLF